MSKRTEQSFFKGRRPNGQKYLKKYSTSLNIKEMQIKTTIKLYHNPVRIQTTTNISEDVGIMEALYTAGGKVS
jgi:hypothetical protein